MSKGSNRRREDTQKIRDNWDKIFGKKDEPKQEKQDNSNDSEVKPMTK